MIISAPADAIGAYRSTRLTRWPKEPARTRYACELARLLRPDGDYMLYAWLPRPWKGGTYGISAEAVESLLSNEFVRTRLVIGEEKGHPSAWYGYRRR
jgi:hypothetical protein